VRSWLSGGDKGDVTVDLRDSRIAEVCRRYDLAELSVFGSVARGDDTDSSDVDVLYVLAPDSASWRGSSTAGTTWRRRSRVVTGSAAGVRAPQA
jgi:hypothetical protein